MTKTVSKKNKSVKIWLIKTKAEADSDAIKHQTNKNFDMVLVILVK